ncbi:hypothetical protein DMC30DRAFT_399852 [Rhodotorula diobovata]|uniref:SET domain-containing protein n=1 Tax=Rhodotorula diobovata TaxID=5288 RepID=A0A5C5FRY3_9BASI|nr:hypothetical protein DMC30DRAFT_399852 [Rhodotorula diobovata]
MASPQTPPGFPSDVRYLTTPVASPLLPALDRLTYTTPCPPHLLPNPPPRVAIRVITDPRHPAKGQRGLFNAGTEDLERGTWIRDYVGWVHTEAEADPKSEYDLSLERRAVTPLGGEGADEASGESRFEVVGCDATTMGGEARFVNDYRGVPGFERPNAVFELRSWDIPGMVGRKGVRMAVWAGPHGVAKGAEICVSYGKGYWRPKEAQGQSRLAEGAKEEPRAKVGRGRRVAKAKQG